MKFYLTFWLLITLLLGFEYYALNLNPNLSLLIKMQAMHYLPADIKLNTAPGRILSLWVGWAGFGLMVLMNLYSMRKRFEFMQNLGKLSSWLNFHIFCGILGPTLIFFHCGLKVRGLVGISFWSMIVSLTSGIIGRYFFVQLSSQKNDFLQKSELALQKLDLIFSKNNLSVDETQKNKMLAFSLKHVGGFPNEEFVNPMLALFSAISGDLRLLFQDMPTPRNWPRSTKPILSLYAKNQRKAQFLGPFEKMMGYWHAFHFPFAVFMYVAAIIHIASSLIFLGKA